MVGLNNNRLLNNEKLPITDREFIVDNIRNIIPEV